MFSEQVHRRASSRETTRAGVLSTASRLLVEKGPGVTIRHIADEAGVSVGTVMGVGDKDTLIALVVDAVVSDAATPSAPPASDPVTAVMQEVRPFVHWFSAHPDLARAYLAILVAGAHRSQVFTTLARQLIEAITVALGRGPAAADRARLIHRAYLGELVIWSGSGTADPTDALAGIERSVRAAIGTDDGHDTDR